MEELNKKTLLHIFLGFIVLQTFILLAVSANFLLAQTDDTNTTTNPTIEITVQTENNQTVLQGMKYFYAYTNYSLDNLTFYFDNLSTTAVDDYPFDSGVSADLSSWSTEINTGVMPDGQYKFYAKGYYNSIYYDSKNYINVTIDNNSAATDTELTVEFSSIPPLSIYGENTISATTNIEPDFIEFRISGPQYSTFSGAMDNLTSYHFIWDTVSFPDGYYYVEVIVQKGTYEACASFNVNVENSSSTESYDDDNTTTSDTQSNPADPNYISTYDDPTYDDSNVTSDNDDPTIPDDTQDDPVDTTTTPLILTFLEQFESPLFGDQRISISSNQEIFNCVFKIYGPRYAEFSGTKDSPTDYHFILHTKDFPDGDYTIKAVAGNNIGTAEVRLDVGIKNQIAIEPNQPTGIEPVYYPTESAPTETVFISYPDQSISDSSIIKIDYPETTYLQPEQIVIKITPECVSQGIDNQEECDQLMKSLFRLTFECRNANITNAEECDKFMMENFMPEECRQQGITNKEECDYLLRNIYRDFEIVVEKTVLTDFDYKSPLIKEIIEIELPEECRAANITTKEECEKYMFEKFAPDDCREAGISNPEACKKYMFEKYNSTENIPQNKFPIECQKANVQTIEECDQIMKRIYLPQECKAEGIENENECEFYLNEKYMPQECREAGAKSRSECDKIMFKKFSPPECREAGIENEQECQEFMFNKYTPQVRCDNLEDWQCNDFIKERHLGNIVAKQIVYNRINEKKEEITGKSMKAEELEIEIIQEEKIVPFLKKDIGIRIIATNESIVLNEEDNLIQTAPIAFMIDSDEDGLPDDMEKRFGTNPFKADTDEDGYNDGEEIKNGQNPLGEGAFEKTLAPIEKAIMENKSLGHPIIEGEEEENFFVENISNMEDAQGNSVEGYILSGKTKPNSVATLYIYSDLPIVVTVNADEYGNWQYQLDQSLIEGEHEVYVAINDDTGKVIEKSKPLNFFIKEASAVSVKDFVSVAKASSEDTKESEVSIYYYLLITLFMAIAGIFLFLAVIIGRKKNRTLQ